MEKQDHKAEIQSSKSQIKNVKPVAVMEKQDFL